MPTLASMAVVIGLIGVVINLGAYLLLSTGRMRANQPRYQWMNIVGTLAIITSLCAQMNMPAMVLNIAWLTVSVAGLFRIYRVRGR